MYIFYILIYVYIGIYVNKHVYIHMCVCWFCQCFQLPFHEPRQQYANTFSQVGYLYIYIVEYMFELGFILLNTLLLQAAAGSSPARASQMP